MDSRDVNKAIARSIKPLLRSNGFASSTTRTFWRHHQNKVDVVNFQSFNSHLAEILGCTTYSFAINLGILFLCVPGFRVKEKNGLMLPQEYVCHFRKKIEKGLKQKQLPSKDTFFVAADGLNLIDVMDDAVVRLRETAFPWFEEYDDMDSVLRTLLEDDEDMQGTWGMGMNPSPMRSYLTGYVAKDLKRWDIAALAFKHVIDSDILRDRQVDQAYAEVLPWLTESSH